VQFLLSETNAGSSSTKRLINHLKSKHRVQVILESEEHKTVPAQEEIRSQIVKKETRVFEVAKKRSNNLKCLKSSPNQWNQRGLFQSRDYFRKTQKQTEWWKCVLIVMRQYYKHHWKTMLNLINNSLINFAGFSH